MEHNSLFSAENLMEFGIGMAMARQMVNMFNQSMPDLSQTVSYTADAANDIMYYVDVDGKPAGPLHEAELIQLIQNRSVNKDTLVWVKGMPTWKPIQDVPQVLKLVALNSTNLIK